MTGGTSSGRGLGLVLDLSHAGFAAVLNAEGGEVLARSARPSGTRHDDVADWVESLLVTAGGRLTDLTWICVGVGPGSFTGIRIAMAFVQGLAQGLSSSRAVTIYGFTSFEALLLSFASANSTTRNSAIPATTGILSARPALAVIPANAGRFYVSRALDDAGALIDGTALAALSDASAVILTPDLTPALTASGGGFADIWIPESAPEKIWDGVAIARHARASGRGAERPVYLQLSAAEEKFGQATL